MEPRNPIPKYILVVLNQLYELEQKLKKQSDPANLSRNLGKMKDAFAEEGLVYEDPIGQPFRETRTELDATIAGSSTEDLIVVEVIKPIIRASAGDGRSQIVQRGVVIVESRKGQ